MDIDKYGNTVYRYILFVYSCLDTIIPYFTKVDSVKINTLYKYLFYAPIFIFLHLLRWVVFIFDSTHAPYYAYWFAYGELFFHGWNALILIKVSDLFNRVTEFDLTKFYQVFLNLC